MLSFEAWDRLRSQQRLSADQTVTVLECLALAAWQGSSR